MSYYYEKYWTPTTPRHTDKGVKAFSRRGSFGKHWWSKKWISALERLMDSARLRRGRRYARSGQVISIEETGEGRIKAEVQGSRAKPYKVSIKLRQLSDEEWDRVLDIMAENAFFTAQLLAGEMPPEIEEAFASAGVELFPGSRSDLETSCTCPDWANPCKHVAAVYYILAERFDEDPFMLFRLRGRSQEQIMEAIRLRQGELSEEEEEQEEEVPPLEEAVAGFWSFRASPDEFRIDPGPPEVRHHVLKRLGKPAFLDAEGWRTLSEMYDAVSREAIQMAQEGTQEDAKTDCRTG